MWSYLTIVFLYPLSLFPPAVQLKYAQMVSSKVDGQRQNVQQALKDAETRIRQFLTCQAKPDPSEDFACWIAQEKSDDKDIQWLLDSSPEKKKVS